MNHVNPWLLALAFVLGLALTLAFMIRRVKREVPSYGASAAKLASTSAPTAEAETEVFARPKDTEAKVEEPTTDTEARTEVFSRPKVDEAKTETISLPQAGAATGTAGLVGAAALAGSGTESDEGPSGTIDSGTAKFAATDTEGPHGPGSAKPETDGSGPSGWTIKGNEESKLYHSPESPSFGVTRAEVWFRDVETAEAAGFNRWDSGKSQRGRKK